MHVPKEVLDRGCEDFYLSMINKGESPRMAEMLALRQAPCINTDDTFLAGQGTLDRQIKHEKMLDHITQSAIRHGYKPRPTDVYNSAIARFPGDPRAFLNHGEARSKVRDVCESEGWSCEGAVKVKGRQPEDEPKPVHKLAPKIVDRICKQKINENPDLARIDRRDLEAEVISKHGKK